MAPRRRPPRRGAPGCRCCRLDCRRRVAAAAAVTACTVAPATLTHVWRQRGHDPRGTVREWRVTPGQAGGGRDAGGRAGGCRAGSCVRRGRLLRRGRRGEGGWGWREGEAGAHTGADARQRRKEKQLREHDGLWWPTPLLPLSTTATGRKEKAIQRGVTMLPPSTLPTPPHPPPPARDIFPLSTTHTTAAGAILRQAAATGGWTTAALFSRHNRPRPGCGTPLPAAIGEKRGRGAR